jgi:cytochrome b
LLALVLFRLMWGLFGSETARFARFLAAPRVAVRHLAHLLRAEPDTRAGHNPAGGWMVVLLLALLLAQALTGLYVNNDVADQGPLTAVAPAAVANLVTALHDTVLWDALLAAVALHVLAIVIYRLAKRHSLLLPMITGRKMLPQRVPAPRLASPVRALLLLACAAGAAAALATCL